MGFVTELLSTSDVASVLQVSPQRVRSLARDGVLPAIRGEAGTGWSFRLADVQRYQDNRPLRRGPRSRLALAERSTSATGPGPAPARLAALHEENEALRVANEELRAENQALLGELAQLRAESQGLRAKLQLTRALGEVLVRELD